MDRYTRRQHMKRHKKKMKQLQMSIFKCVGKRHVIFFLTDQQHPHFWTKTLIFIRKETSLTLNREGERELSKIYDLLLPSSTRPTVSSRSGSVSCNSSTIRWGQRRVSLKYLGQNHECCWSVLNDLWWSSYLFHSYTQTSLVSLLALLFLFALSISTSCVKQILTLAALWWYGKTDTTAKKSKRS